MAKPMGVALQATIEFLGTAMYLYLAVGAANAVTYDLPVGANGLVQAFCYGFSLISIVWVFYRISGAMFNPAIAFSSMITGHISFIKFAVYVLAQMLGAMLGVACVRGTTPSSEHNNQVNEIAHGESMARAFFLEFFLSMIVCFIYHIVAHEKNRSTFLVAIPYGLTIFVCHLFATRYDNAAINPARAFATSVVFRWFPSDHWIFWFGPLTGAIMAAAFHILFRMMAYDRHSAGIDASDEGQYARARAAYHSQNERNNQD